MPKKKILAIRVVLVDDHAIVRDGIRELLSQTKEIQVVGEAADGAQAVEMVAAQHPDVALMDITMPRMDGLEATKQITASFPDTRVLVLTQHESLDFVLPLLRAGAAGYVLKLTTGEELIRAIRAVHTTGTFLPPKVLHTLVDGIAQSPATGGQSTLTDREKEMVQLVTEGLSVQEIAKRLCISPKTVLTHRSNIMEKLGVHNTAELVRYAIRRGIVKA